MTDQRIISDMRRQLKQDPALASRFLQRLMGLQEFREMLNKTRFFKPRQVVLNLLFHKQVDIKLVSVGQNGFI